jgi:hypothetical protein
MGGKGGGGYDPRSGRGMEKVDVSDTRYYAPLFIYARGTYELWAQAPREFQSASHSPRMRLWTCEWALRRPEGFRLRSPGGMSASSF